MPTPAQLFDQAVQLRGPAPFVTYYNERTGERAELSAKSLGNWVAKTHFLLLDELGLGAGDRAYIALPADWVSVAIILGCWSASVAVSEVPSDAQVAFVTTETPDVPEVFSVNTGSLSRSFGADAPAGTADYVSAVRPQADVWRTVRNSSDPAAAVIITEDRVIMAAEAVTGVTVGEGARLLHSVDEHPISVQSWLDLLVTPLVSGGSLVLVAGADDATLTRRAEQERATRL